MPNRSNVLPPHGTFFAYVIYVSFIKLCIVIGLHTQSLHVRNPLVVCSFCSVGHLKDLTEGVLSAANVKPGLTAFSTAVISLFMNAVVPTSVLEQPYNVYQADRVYAGYRAGKRDELRYADADKAARSFALVEVHVHHRDGLV